MTPSHRPELEHAGKHIRHNFRAIVFEPLPRELLDLLRELEETERKPKELEGPGDK